MPKVKCGNCADFHSYPKPYDYEGWCEGHCSCASPYMGTNWRLNVRKRDTLRYCKAFRSKDGNNKEKEEVKV